MKTKLFLWLSIGLSLCSPNSQLAQAAPATRLSSDGKALLPIVIAPRLDATIETGAALGRIKNPTPKQAQILEAAQQAQTIKNAAQQLADYLKRISGATYEIKSGDGKSGIAVGTAAGFPALNLSNEFDTTDPKRVEEYILRSTPNGVLLVGATGTAVQNAVWDFLYRLGYRHFFPDTAWEVVPSEKNLSIALDVKEKPDFFARRIWFTYSTWPDNGNRMSEWSAKNRVLRGIDMSSGHAYEAIIARHKAEFEKHPEYLTAPGSDKFCVSNPGLRQLVIQDALDFFEKNPNADSISMDPSDGGGWASDSCPDEQQIGSVSNRVVTLANAVAEAVSKKFPGKFVGFYAYNFHSPPPTIRVHPNAVVSVATSFLKGGYTVDQLMEGWQKQGATLGVREYFSIIHWDKDLPRARASKPEYMARTIPHFYNKGARFMSAESSDNWGPNGLGYYLASRYLWDVDEAINQDALIEDFLEKSFGPAREPMREYYGLINGIGNATARPISDDFVGRMYRALGVAYQKTDDAAIRARLDDLALYTHYIELFLEYSSREDADRQVAYEALIKFAWRIRDTHMLHSLGIYRTGLRDKSVKIPAAARYSIPEKDKKTGQPLNPWKQSTPFAPAEVQTLVKSGVARNQLVDFEPKSFSTDLVPATPLNLAPVPAIEYPTQRGVLDFYLWASQPGAIRFTGLAGNYYKNRGNAKVQFFRDEDAVGVGDDEAGGDEDEDAAPIGPVPLAQAEIKPDLQEQEFSFDAPAAGLYRVRLLDSKMGSLLRFAPEVPVSIRSDLEVKPRFGGRWKLYFYVPKGTKTVGGFAFGRGLVHDAEGKAIFTHPDQGGYFSIPVPAGQDGKLWSFVNVKGAIGLMTVPPYLTRSEKDLLLPREVVEADAAK